MPLRKQAFKRRMYHGPEMELKLAFFLAHQLHIQDIQQQPPVPFSESPLGRLPGEIRDMIYEFVLVAPPSESKRYLRVPVIAATNSNIASADRSIMTMQSENGSAEPLQSEPAHHISPRKVSYVAILQTCRQIYREAYHIFYAKNAFHLTNAPDLIAFLKGIGPARRAELTSLHIEGLVVDQPWDRARVRSFCQRFNITSAAEERMVAVPRRSIHPDLSNDDSKSIFGGCHNLSRLILEMEAKYGYSYVFFLKCCLGLRKSLIHLIDESRWIVLPRQVGLSGPHIIEAIKEAIEVFDCYRDCFPGWTPWSRVRVEVEILRDPELLLKKGVKTWAVI